MIVLSWRDALPDPVATHWSGGSTPDGFAGLTGFLVTMGVTGLGCLVLFGAIALFMGRTAGTLRMTAGGSIWIAGMLATITTGSLAFQRGLADAHQVGLPGWLLPTALLAPVIPAVIAALMVPADRHQPAATAIPEGAPQVPLGASARAVWLRRTSGGPGVAIAVGAILLVVVLSVALDVLGMLAIVAALVLLLAAQGPGAGVPGSQPCFQSATRCGRVKHRQAIIPAAARPTDSHIESPIACARSGRTWARQVMRVAIPADPSTAAICCISE